MIDFSPGEIALLSFAASTGSSRMMCIIVSVAVSPVNGSFPVAPSYSTTPSEKMSVRPSRFFPSACSGDM